MWRAYFSQSHEYEDSKQAETERRRQEEEVAAHQRAETERRRQEEEIAARQQKEQRQQEPMEGFFYIIAILVFVAFVMLTQIVWLAK